MALFYIGATILLIARNAWVADVAVDYDDRSRHFVMIEVVSILSMLILLIVPVLVGLSNPEADRADKVAAMGWCLIASLPVTAWLACNFVPDRPSAATKETHAISLAQLREALGNKLLRTVLLLETCIGVAISVTSSLYLFVAESVFGLKGDEAEMLLIVFFLSSVLGLPFWMWLARRMEKHKAVCVAVLMMAATYIAYFFSAQSGGFWPFAISALLNGFGFTAAIVIGRSMTADVIEWERARTGKNRAGLYYGMNAAAYKIGASVAIGAAYLLVGLWAGYEAGGENSAEVVQRLLIVFCVLPAALYVLCYFFVRKFRLNRAMQQATAEQLRASETAF
jgi:Na+/melibiose symporter-like transporter